MFPQDITRQEIPCSIYTYRWLSAPLTILPCYFTKRLDLEEGFCTIRGRTRHKRGKGTHNRNAVFPPSPSPVRGSSPRKDFWGPFNPLQTFLCIFTCTQRLPLPCSHSNFHPPYYIFYEKAKTEVHSYPRLCRELAWAWLTVTRTSTAWYTSEHTNEQVLILHNLNYILQSLHRKFIFKV